MTICFEHHFQKDHYYYLLAVEPTVQAMARIKEKFEIITVIQRFMIVAIVKNLMIDSSWNL